MRDYVDIKIYFYQTLGAADPTRSAAPKLMVVRVQRIQALILQKVNVGSYGDSGDEIDGFIAEGSDSSLSCGENDEIEEFEELHKRLKTLQVQQRRGLELLNLLKT